MSPSLNDRYGSCDFGENPAPGFSLTVLLHKRKKGKNREELAMATASSAQTKALDSRQAKLRTRPLPLLTIKAQRLLQLPCVVLCCASPLGACLLVICSSAALSRRPCSSLASHIPPLGK
uniref:Uncharacterized protein n=1 Tax=Knipowitschia caucasica TaxID=637954 RepID=A0AAV2L7A6_KNICA